jgi:hypothetical protein
MIHVIVQHCITPSHTAHSRSCRALTSVLRRDLPLRAERCAVVRERRELARAGHTRDAARGREALGRELVRDASGEHELAGLGAAVEERELDHVRGGHAGDGLLDVVETCVLLRCLRDRVRGVADEVLGNEGLEGRS